MPHERFIIAEVINSPDLSNGQGGLNGSNSKDPYLQIKRDKVIVGGTEANRSKIGSFLTYINNAAAGIVTANPSQL